jgi:hypothetical protein
MHAGRQRVGDDFGAGFGRNLKKIMTEVFDQGVRLGGVSSRDKSLCDIRITA